MIQDRGDLRRGPAGQLQPQRGGLGEQLRHRPHLAGIGAGRGPQPVHPARPPGTQPPVDGAARVPPHRPVRVRVLARGDRPHHAPRSPAASRGFAASAITAHRCSAISCRIFSSITLAPPVPGAVTSFASRAPGRHETPPPMTSQGEDALAASRLPPVTALANRHRPSTAHPGRPAAAANAAPTAATAHRSGSGAGRTASPPSSAHSAAKLTASSPARAANRRTQPRAVVYGTPAAAAAGRTPHARPRPARSPRQPTRPHPAAGPATNAGSSA